MKRRATRWREGVSPSLRAAGDLFVGATLVVARVGHADGVPHSKTGDHKGRPYGSLGRLAWLASLGLLFGVVGAWLLADDPLAPAPPAPSLAQEPDVLLEEADILEFGEDGALRYSVQSNKAVWFRQGGDMALTAPQLVVPDEHGVPWRVVAERGDVQGAGGGASMQVDLAGRVVLRRDDGGAFVQVATEALELHPGERRAATERPVSITTERSRIEAGGLDADLADGTLRLRGGVEAVDEGDGSREDAPQPQEHAG